MLKGGITGKSVEQGSGGAGDQEISAAFVQFPGSDLPIPIYYLLVALIVIASIAWRVGNLDAFSLSNDEGAYLMWAWLVHSGHPLYSETVSVSAPFLITVLDWAFDLGGVGLVTGRVLVLGFLGLALFSLAWAGKLLHHWLAGLMAALAFGLAPLAFALSRMAVGEVPSLALACLSLASALNYWRRGGESWLAFSGLALSLSLLVKAMNPLVALPVLWLVVARHWRRQASWSRIVIALAVWGLAGLLPIFVCLLVYDPAAMYDQAIAFRFELRAASAWLLADNVAQLRLFLEQQWGIVGLALTGFVLLAYRAGWETLLPLGLWLAGNLFSVLFHSPLFLHHTIILLPPLALLAGIGLAETALLLQERRWAWSTLGMAGGLAFLLALPGTVQANQTAKGAGFGREAQAITFLKQITYPTDNVISDNLLLPFMAKRQTPPPLGDIAQVAINSGRQTSERLIAISEAYPVEAVASWALRLPHLDKYMDWVANSYLVERVWDDHHVIYFGRRVLKDLVPNRIDAQVGDSIALLGYDIVSSQGATAGKLYDTEDNSQTLDVTLYWEARNPVEEDYTVFVQLLDSEGQLVTQHDGQPLYGYLPTGGWSPDEVVPDRHRLPLPDGMSPGRYQLIAGMYTLETLERLPVYVAHTVGTYDNVMLSQIEIEESGLETGD
jgi:hypothetical protein